MGHIWKLISLWTNIYKYYLNPIEKLQTEEILNDEHYSELALEN